MAQYLRCSCIVVTEDCHERRQQGGLKERAAALTAAPQLLQPERDQRLRGQGLGSRRWVAQSGQEERHYFRVVLRRKAGGRRKRATDKRGGRR